MKGIKTKLTHKIQTKVSGSRHRYVDGRFNLDLSFITDNVIAMSMPSSGLSSAWRNPIDHVADFFHERYHNDYLIFNLSDMRSYDYSKFDDQVTEFAFPDHYPPPLSLLFQVVIVMHQFLSADPKHVVAIHCKGGKGRTGTIISAYLLFVGICKDAVSACSMFAERRSSKRVGGGVTRPAQMRYVHYFSSVLHDSVIPDVSPRYLRSVILLPAPRRKVDKNKGNFDTKLKPVIRIYSTARLPPILLYSSHDQSPSTLDPEVVAWQFSKRRMPLSADVLITIVHQRKPLSSSSSDPISGNGGNSSFAPCSIVDFQSDDPTSTSTPGSSSSATSPTISSSSASNNNEKSVKTFKTLFRIGFHSAFVPSTNALVFPVSSLDGVNTKDFHFPESFTLQLIFERDEVSMESLGLRGGRKSSIAASNESSSKNAQIYMNDEEHSVYLKAFAKCGWLNKTPSSPSNSTGVPRSRSPSSPSPDPNSPHPRTKEELWWDMRTSLGANGNEDNVANVGISDEKSREKKEDSGGGTEAEEEEDMALAAADDIEKSIQKALGSSTLSPSSPLSTMESSSPATIAANTSQQPQQRRRGLSLSIKRAGRRLGGDRDRAGRSATISVSGVPSPSHASSVTSVVTEEEKEEEEEEVGELTLEDIRSTIRSLPRRFVRENLTVPEKHRSITALDYSESDMSSNDDDDDVYAFASSDEEEEDGRSRSNNNEHDKKEREDSSNSSADDDEGGGGGDNIHSDEDGEDVVVVYASSGSESDTPEDDESNDESEHGPKSLPGSDVRSHSLKRTVWESRMAAMNQTEDADVLRKQLLLGTLSSVDTSGGGRGNNNSSNQETVGNSSGKSFLKRFGRKR